MTKCRYGYLIQLFPPVIENLSFVPIYCNIETFITPSIEGYFFKN